MLAVLSSSDAQNGDHAKLLLEERVPPLNCCKQRFENPGGGWQTCSSTFQPLWFFLSFIVVVVVVSYQFILCSKVEKHPWTSSSIFRLPASPFVHCREHRQEESFSPGGTLWGGAGFTVAAERINYWWTPPPTSRLKSHQASESRDSGRGKEISGDSVGASATNSVVVNLQGIFVISNKPKTTFMCFKSWLNF